MVGEANDRWSRCHAELEERMQSVLAPMQTNMRQICENKYANRDKSATVPLARVVEWCPWLAGSEMMCCAGLPAGTFAETITELLAEFLAEPLTEHLAESLADPIPRPKA